jgi:hypothetical protein
MTISTGHPGDPTLVPFEARRLAQPRVVMLNRELLDIGEDEILDRFAFSIPAQRDPPGMYESRTKTLYGERYGGEGIGVHGGGVRVGLAGNYQIKGIGRNPLAGKDSPLDYSHGGVSLFEAIQEALWSEALQNALPYGAVRCPAILATQSPCWWVIDRWGEDLLRERYGEDVHLPRGLIVRETAIRPAHFERAMLYQPDALLSESLSSDVERVRAAIARLPDVLPLPAAEAARSPPVERLCIGMLEMARRFAEQAAAARSKRLIHGNIGSSNICLDGRWIDFGSATAIPGWGDVGGYGPFWDDSENYGRIFSTMCFNIRKYFPIDAAIPPDQDTLLQEYRSTHARAMRKRFLGLTGIPFELLEHRLSSEECSQLFHLLTLIARLGHRDPFEGHPDDESTFGKYRLGAILAVLARGTDSPRRVERLNEVLPDKALQQKLLDAYAPVLRLAISAAADAGVSADALKRLMAINAAKVAKSIKLLYRPHMVAHAERMVLQHRDLSELRVAASDWFDELSDETGLIYQDPAGLTTTVWRRRSDRIVFDARRNEFLVFENSGAIPSRTAGSLVRLLANCAAARDAVDYWGHDFNEDVA